MRDALKRQREPDSISLQSEAAKVVWNKMISI
jgi:hypothetical protein